MDNNEPKKIDSKKIMEEYLERQLSLIECDLLSIDDLDKYKYDGAMLTDICYITSGITSQYDKGYFKNTFLKDIKEDDNCNIQYLNSAGHITSKDLIENHIRNNYNRNGRRRFMITPVLDFSKCPELFDLITTKKENGKEALELNEVKFGWYPDYAENISTQSLLNIEFAKKNSAIKKIEGKYTFDETSYLHLTAPFKPLQYPVYERDGTKYLRIKLETIPRRSIEEVLECDDKPIMRLNNSSEWHRNEKIWIKVSKKAWTVDRKNKKLIANEAMLSGIQFAKFDRSFGPLDYNTSNVKWFMDTYIKKELLQFVNVKDLNLDYDFRFAKLAILDYKNKNKTIQEKVKQEVKTALKAVEKPIEEKKEEVEKKSVNPKKQEIISLLESIREYKEYYLGNDDINQKVKKLYKDYLKKIDELTKNKNDMGLYLGTRDPQNIYRDLIADLTKILDNLKLNSLKVKDSLDMISILEECRKQTIDVNKDLICQKVNDLNNTILSFDTDIKNKNNLIKELDDILSKNISRINSYVDEYKKNINAKTRTIDELKEEFSKDFAPFENKINHLSIFYNMINILSECKKDKVDPNKDAICYSVNNIKTVVIEFIKDIKIKKELYNELDEILTNSINKLKNVVNEKNIDENITMDDLRSDFGKVFTPFIAKLQRLVSTQDMINDIIKEVEEMINNHFKESKIEVAKLYLDELNNTISEIKEIGSPEDIVELKKKIVYDFDITKDITDIINKLREYINTAHQFKFGIMERKKKQKEIEEYKDEVDVESILNGKIK